MAKINLLPKSVAELIAAGEVVERPSSVIKELCENSIDAGADKITVEIKNGGVTFMRITDNGCGMFPEDVPTAFLRHATSKISTGADLDSIATLGFRGEALAAVSSVARIELLTKPHELDMGTRYVIEGGEELFYDEAGCADGTVITVRDLFFNTPARMKFLKKDVTEGNSVAAVMDRIALSHPEVAVKFIRDDKTVMTTPGNGNLKDTVYAVCGREFANEMMELSGDLNGIKVSGMVCKPVACKPTRNGQYTFLNGRFVRSGTVAAALEQAYKGSAMVGKYPSAVIFLTVPFGAVDVNVHPAKTEVRFSDERRIFEAVYHSALNAISHRDERPTMSFATKKPNNAFLNMTAEQYKQAALPVDPPKPTKTIYQPKKDDLSVASSVNFKVEQPKPIQRVDEESLIKPIPSKPVQVATQTVEKVPAPTPTFQEKPIVAEEKAATYEQIAPVEPKPEIKFIGEVFKTYILAELDGELYFIDKHAAHERILYEELKKSTKPETQVLLTPESIVLSKEDYDIVISAENELMEIGFEIEDFGNGTLLIRAIPSVLLGENLSSVISEIAESLRIKGKPDAYKLDDVYHRIACRAAVKAGNTTTSLEAKALAERVLSNKDIMYCPHGRPVAVKMSKREIEKQFGRIQ